ncbi:MAG TPA: PQQ-binding-like beta-propeller repeat protein [Pirellulales bacterium]|nr:PQQ-binding-like beta-propeller repeat protein [Pirellulales bacterium]
MTRWILLIAILGSIARADDTWPQFRGPGGQGHALGTNLPLTFGEDEHVTWKTALPGEGWSSPVSDGRTLWMTTAVEQADSQVSLRALGVDVASGKLIANVEVLPPVAAIPKNSKNSHASPSPVLEAGRLYMHFGTYGSACLDTATGKVVWTRTDLHLEHKEGPGSSPLLYGDLMIFNCDGMDVQFVVALDKRTGNVVWKTKRTGELSPNPDFCKAYATPLVIHADGRDQLISPGAWQVVSYEPATGKEIWKVWYTPGFSNVPRPLFGNGLLYVCTGFGKPQLWAIKPEGTGDITETAVVWKLPKQAPANPSPILVGDTIFMVADKGVATCVDALTGEVIWTERLAGNFSASPIFVDGRLYFSCEDGTVYVIAPEREFKLLATNHLDGRLMASPAVLHNAMFFRSDTALYRIEQK